jgi:hypothetical protein
VSRLLPSRYYNARWLIVHLSLVISFQAFFFVFLLGDTCKKLNFYAAVQPQLTNYWQNQEPALKLVEQYCQ